MYTGEGAMGSMVRTGQKDHSSWAHGGRLHFVQAPFTAPPHAWGLADPVLLSQFLS
jgi:hypothetical protein